MMTLQPGGALLIGLLLFHRNYMQDLETKFLAAAKRGDAAAVRTFLARGVDVNAKSAYGGTALAFAADKGHLEIVQLLIKHKAKVNATDSFYGAAPLTWAAQRDNVAIVKSLLDAGATGGDTVLLGAAREGKLEMLQAVLDKAKIKPETLSAALAFAPAKQPKVAELLTRAGAKPAKPGFALDAETLKSYAGTYEGQNAELQLVPENGMMRLKFGEFTLAILVPTSKTTFRALGGESTTIYAMKLEGGKVTGFDVKALIVTAASFKRTEPRKVATPLPKPVESNGKVAEPRNWPSFRGAYASGVADGQYPPTTWDAEKGVNLRWKTPIPGLGHSSPIVWGERIFLTTAVSGDPKSKFRSGQYGDVDSVNDTTIHSWRVYCLDKATGKTLWERVAHQGVPKVKRHMKASHANPTPATDGKHVIACFGSEGLYCYDLDGTLLWKRDVGVLDSGWFYDPEYQWGFASSPILYRNLVILQCDVGKNSFIAAYDVTNGKQVWRAPREEVPSWGTPTIYDGQPRPMVVTNASKFIRGYDPLTGKELWRLGRNSEVTVGTPVWGQGLIFATGGYPPIRPVYAIRPTASGDITLPSGKTSSAAIAWSYPKEGTYMPTPIVYGDYLYTCANSGRVTCYEAKTGKQMYQRTLGGRGGFTASPVAADGKLYFTSEEGGILVVQAGPNYTLLAANPIGDVCMATPAIADGMLFVRSQHYLFGIGRPAVPQSSSVR